MEAYELRQVRKKAAVSMKFHVVQGYPVWAGCKYSLDGRCRMWGAWSFLIYLCQ